VGERSKRKSTRERWSEGDSEEERERDRRERERERDRDRERERESHVVRSPLNTADGNCTMYV